jgi:hypothetical protein
LPRGEDARHQPKQFALSQTLPTVRIEALREHAYAGTSGPELLRYFVVMACADQ